MVKGQKMGQILTHCQRGHELTEDNVIWRKRDRGRGEEMTRICKECHRERGRKWSKNLSKEKKLTRNLYRREWRKLNKDYVKSQKLKFCFGISLEEYKIILEYQGNKCPVCGKLATDKKYFDVDHDHETGEIRGILCSRCNRSLGWYEKCRKEIETYLDTINERRINKSA
jgi:hypothetical protein